MVVHRCAARYTRNPDGTFMYDKFMFRVPEVVYCPFSSNDPGHNCHSAAGLLPENKGPPSAIKALRAVHRHLMRQTCFNMFMSQWFPEGKEVWLQIGQHGPCIQLQKPGAGEEEDSEATSGSDTEANDSESDVDMVTILDNPTPKRKGDPLEGVRRKKQELTVYMNTLAAQATPQPPAAATPKPPAAATPEPPAATTPEPPAAATPEPPAAATPQPPAAATPEPPAAATPQPPAAATPEPPAAATPQPPAAATPNPPAAATPEPPMLPIASALQSEPQMPQIPLLPPTTEAHVVHDEPRTLTAFRELYISIMEAILDLDKQGSSLYKMVQEHERTCAELRNFVAPNLIVKKAVQAQLACEQEQLEGCMEEYTDNTVAGRKQSELEYFCNDHFGDDVKLAAIVVKE
ncbi:TPA: hypothetical protein ACH3X1_015791 [Trebouxia sp. C0004]